MSPFDSNGRMIFAVIIRHNSQAFRYAFSYSIKRGKDKSRNRVDVATDIKSSRFFV